MKTVYAWLFILSSTLSTSIVSANNVSALEYENQDAQLKIDTAGLESLEFEDLDLDALLANISEEDIRSVYENEPPPDWHELWGQRLKLASSFLQIKGGEAKNKAIHHLRENRQIYITGAISTTSVILLLLAVHYGLKYYPAG